MQQSFRLVQTHAAYAPDNLEFPRRTGQNVIGFRNGARVLNGCETFGSPLIQVEVNMPDERYVFLRTGRAILPEWVHSYVNVRPARIFVTQPCLKLGARRLLCTGDALNGFPEIAV